MAQLLRARLITKNIKVRFPASTAVSPATTKIISVIFLNLCVCVCDLVSECHMCADAQRPEDSVRSFGGDLQVVVT